MHAMRLPLAVVVLLVAGARLTTSTSHAQAFTDPGFENYAVNPGGFLQPTNGPWGFVNDAGVVEPPAPNSSTGPLNTWSATFPAIQGSQYASTYAGADTIRQTVTFGAAGNYRISAYAAAPSGTLTIPTVGTVTLGDGEFSFTLGAASIGNLIPVTAGSTWALYSADFNIPSAGSYQLGVHNTKASPYFINYDDFAIQPVPEPTPVALALCGFAAVLAACLFRRSRVR